jgi:hypothetical protein
VVQTAVPPSEPLAFPGQATGTPVRGRLDFLLEKLSEPSTWRGIISLLTASGITLAPDYQNAIIALGMASIGLINVIRKEKSGKTINTTAPVTVTGGAIVETK